LVDLDIIYNNHDGLSKVYNQAIDNNKDVDFLIFVHDDIVLNDCLFYDKVLESKFDVIGAVGGLCWAVPKGFPIEEKPLIWTVATCGQGASGFMNHDFGNGNFLPSSYGPAPA
jgi:glycosyltransferase involved in cell wall biosynthesis